MQANAAHVLDRPRSRHGNKASVLVPRAVSHAGCKGSRSELRHSDRPIRELSWHRAHHARRGARCHTNRIKIAPMVAATKVRKKPNTGMFRMLASTPTTKAPAMPTRILVKML